MSNTQNEIIVENPTVEFLTALEELVGTGGQTRGITFLVQGSAFSDIVSTCLETGVRFSVTPTELPVTNQNTTPTTMEPSYDHDSGPTSGQHVAHAGKQGDPSARIPDGEETIPPTHGTSQPHRNPASTNHGSTDEWPTAAATHSRTASEEMRPAIQSNTRQLEVDHHRRILELAFSHHLERPGKGEHAYIEIRVASGQPPVQYHYLDTGSGRGGAHLFKNLSPQTKAAITYQAATTGLCVLAEGEGYVSVSFCQSTVNDDVSFAEHVISEVLDASLTDITRIDEVINREDTRTWLD